MSDDSETWSTEFEVGIDCAPGTARPDTILMLVLQAVDTPLTAADFKVVHTLFGHWTFALRKEKESLYREAKQKIGEQLKKHYAQGSIRYASW